MISLNSVDGYDWNTIEPFFETLLSEALTPGGVGEWLARWSDLQKLLGEAESSAYRAATEDTTNQEAEQRYLHYVQEIVPRSQVAQQSLTTMLLGLEGYVPEPEHREMVRRFRNDQELFRDENVPLKAAAEARSNEYFKITGAMTVSIDGQELTIQEARQRLLAPDRTLREVAWRAIDQRFEQDSDALDALFLELLGMRRQIARNAEQPDYRAYRWRELGRFDYTPADAECLHRAIEDAVVPLASRFVAQRRERLKVESVRPWDLKVDPEARHPLQPFQSAAELEEGASHIFEQLDPTLGRYWMKMRDGFLDLESRKGKAPGAYCSFFPRSGVPYIFMSAVGTHSDVQTLLHESGHAFHALASHETQKLIWNIGAPMEFNEVASMSMELLAAPYLSKARGGFYSPAEAQRALAEQLEYIVTLLPYIAMNDALQHWLYTKAAEDVTIAQIDDKWTSLSERFQPGVDWSGLEGARAGGWRQVLHLFVVPFYMIEYALAQLGALQIWRNAQAHHESALGQYRAALALGNTRPLPDLYEAAGARLAFDEDTVAELVELIASHLEAVARD